MDDLGDTHSSRWTTELATASIGALITGGIAWLSAGVSTTGVVAIAGVGFLASWAAMHAAAQTAHRGRSIVAAMIAMVALGGLALFFHPRGTPPPGVQGFVGGCDPFSVYAQNRWPDFGAAVRAAPSRNANKVGGFGPNALVALDGWVRTEPAY